MVKLIIFCCTYVQVANTRNNFTYRACFKMHKYKMFLNPHIFYCMSDNNYAFTLKFQQHFQKLL
jgi:hypothetical protein